MKSSDLPSELGIKILDSVSTLDKYLFVKNTFNISDKEIELTILDLLYKKYNCKTPIELLWNVKVPKYKLIVKLFDLPDYNKILIGTEKEIIDHISINVMDEINNNEDLSSLNKSRNLYKDAMNLYIEDISTQINDINKGYDSLPISFHEYELLEEGSSTGYYILFGI